MFSRTKMNVAWMYPSEGSTLTDDEIDLISESEITIGVTYDLSMGRDVIAGLLIRVFEGAKWENILRRLKRKNPALVTAIREAKRAGYDYIRLTK